MVSGGLGGLWVGDIVFCFDLEESGGSPGVSPGECPRGSPGGSLGGPQEVPGFRGRYPFDCRFRVRSMLSIGDPGNPISGIQNG